MIEPIDLNEFCECGRSRHRTREQVLEAMRQKPPWRPRERPLFEDLTDEEEETFWRAITEGC